MELNLDLICMKNITLYQQEKMQKKLKRCLAILYVKKDMEFGLINIKNSFITLKIVSFYNKDKFACIYLI